MKTTSAFFCGLVSLSSLVVLPVSQVQAQVTDPAVINFTGGDSTSTLADSTVGWSFTVNKTDTYSYLGIWDEDSDGLALYHEVGLWDSSRQLLATTKIQNGTNSTAALETTGPNGVFRWEPINPVTLSPGETYYLGAFYCTGETYSRSCYCPDESCSPDDAVSDIDLFAVQTNATFSPNINYQRSHVIASSDLTFPVEPDEELFAADFGGSGTDGEFGPNLAQSIPEPVTILGSGVILLIMPLLKKANNRP